MFRTPARALSLLLLILCPGARTAVAAIDLGTNGSGVWRSTDRGATWAPLGTGLYAPRITCLEATPKNPRLLLACTWGGGLMEIRLSSIP